ARNARRTRRRPRRTASGERDSSVRRRREISLLGPRREVRSANADDDAAPGPVAARVARGVAQRVLARQLVGNLPVDVRQLRRLGWEEGAPPGFLRELAQHELGFLEAFGAGRRP